MTRSQGTTETPMEWPTHPDGRKKKMGELTPEQRRYFTRRALLKVQAHLESPEVRRILEVDP